MNTTIAPHAKTTWFIIFWAITASVLIYGYLVFIMERASHRSPPQVIAHSLFRPILYGLDLLDLVLAVVLFKRIISRSTSNAPGISIGYTPRPSPEPEVFQRASLVALSLSESSAIYGLWLFFLGEPAKEFWNFASLTLAFNLLYILPKGLRYWAGQNQG